MKGYSGLVSLCVLVTAGIHFGQTSPSSEDNDDGNTKIDRSPAEEVHIDITVLVGHGVYERWYNLSTSSTETLKRAETIRNIRQYFSLLVNAVDERFKSISDKYNIRLVGFIIEDERAGEWLTKAFEREEILNETRINAISLMEEVSHWSSRGEVFPRSDFIIAFTTYDIYIAVEGSDKDVKGFSKIGTVCNDLDNSVAVVKYTGVFTDDVLVTVHEVAHGLGSLHDGVDDNPCSADDDFIMSPDYGQFHSLEHNNQFHFSPCSAAYIQRHANGIINDRQNNSESYSCLVDKMAPDPITNTTGEVAGQVYSPDVQCQLFYGDQSYFCRTILGTSEMHTICKRLYCFNPEDELCYPINAAEGSSCGDKQWCQTGVCVYSESAPAKNVECMFGDVLTPVYKSLRCWEFITAFFSPVCYSPRLSSLCCHTCVQFNSGDPGCEYGDNYFNTSCSLQQCAQRQDTHYVDVCCDTCREYRTQTSTTSTLTATSTITTQAPTSSSTSTIPPSPFTSMIGSISASTLTSILSSSTSRVSTEMSSSVQSTATSTKHTLSSQKSTSTSTSTIESFVSISSKSISISLSSPKPSSPSPPPPPSSSSSSSSTSPPLPSSSSSSSSSTLSSSSSSSLQSTSSSSLVSHDTLYTSSTSTASPPSLSSTSWRMASTSLAKSTFMTSTTISRESISTPTSTLSINVIQPSSTSPPENGQKTIGSTQGKSSQHSTTNMATSGSLVTSSVTDTSENCFADVACDEDIPGNPSLCYDLLVYTKCCASCRKVSTGNMGCEYDDRSPSACRGRRGYTCCGYETECCATCDNNENFCANGQEVHGLSARFIMFTLIHVFFMIYQKCFT